MSVPVIPYLLCDIHTLLRLRETSKTVCSWLDDPRFLTRLFFQLFNGISYCTEAETVYLTIVLGQCGLCDVLRVHSKVSLTKGDPQGERRLTEGDVGQQELVEC
jgi:hypothetical protein